MSERLLFPSYTKWERKLDACVHGMGVVFAIGAACFLLWVAAMQASAEVMTGATVYCAGLTLMFGASAAYNLAGPPPIKEVLRRLDHAAIFVMIAGSYTPYALCMRGAGGYGLLAVVWLIAAAGVGFKLTYPRRMDKLSVLLYLTQGWIVVFALKAAVASLPHQSLVLLVVGGAIYTLGVPFHLMERLRFHNVIWHAFVLGGAICQYISILGTIRQS